MSMPSSPRAARNFVIFLGRQIDDDQAVDAGIRRIARETRRAIGMDGIEIAHQHDRRVLVALAKPFHQTPARLCSVMPAFSARSDDA